MARLPSMIAITVSFIVLSILCPAVFGQPCPAGCSTCTNNPTICTSCQQGYTLRANNCISCPANCHECAFPDRCVICMPMFYVKSGQCFYKKSLDKDQRNIAIIVAAIFFGLLIIAGLICSIFNTKNFSYGPLPVPVGNVPPGQVLVTEPVQILNIQPVQAPLAGPSPRPMAVQGNIVTKPDRDFEQGAPLMSDRDYQPEITQRTSRPFVR